MKKTTILILQILLTTIIIVVFLVLVDSKYNMRHFFDNWKSEINNDTVSIINDAYDVYNCNGEMLLGLGDYLPSGVLQMVYCMKGERVYFSYGTKNPETALWNIWHIASVRITGENFIEYYSVNLFDDTSTSQTFHDLSCNTSRTEEYGGLYCDNKIYLHGNAMTVVFDLETESLKEISDLPISKYIVEINNNQTLIVEDTDTGTTHTVTLESMANRNMYSKKLLALSNRRIWDGSSPTCKIFSYVKTIDNQIYIVCTVYNWLGESFAVVFRYNFSSDTVYYVSLNKVGGITEYNYRLAPYKNDTRSL